MCQSHSKILITLRPTWVTIEVQISLYPHVRCWTLQKAMQFLCKISKMQVTITSPAPKNKKVWSAKAPPTNLKAATSPARTTEAVPCTRTRFKIQKWISIKVSPEQRTTNLPVYHHWIQDELSHTFWAAQMHYDLQNLQTGKLKQYSGEWWIQVL